MQEVVDVISLPAPTGLIASELRLVHNGAKNDTRTRCNSKYKGTGRGDQKRARDKYSGGREA
jgi:hypothetical protein